MKGVTLSETQFGFLSQANQNPEMIGDLANGWMHRCLRRLHNFALLAWWQGALRMDHDGSIFTYMS